MLLLVCILNINRSISLLVRCRIKTHTLKELFRRVFLSKITVIVVYVTFTAKLPGKTVIANFETPLEYSIIHR